MPRLIWLSLLFIQSGTQRGPAFRSSLEICRHQKLGMAGNRIQGTPGRAVRSGLKRTETRLLMPQAHRRQQISMEACQWSGREALVPMMEPADLGKGNDLSIALRPGCRTDRAGPPGSMDKDRSRPPRSGGRLGHPLPCRSTGRRSGTEPRLAGWDWPDSGCG